MNNPAVFIGAPLDFKKDIQVYPPTVEDVITNKNFQIYLKILTLSQEEIEDELIKNNESLDKFPTPMEYLLALILSDKTGKFLKLAQEAFRFFTHEEVSFLFQDKSIFFGNLEKELAKINDTTKLSDLRIINEEDFFGLQNLIREACGDKPVEPPNPNEDPRVKRIKAKARYRDRIKAKQKNGLELPTILASICCMNVGLNPLNIREISYASVGLLMSTYQAKEEYENGVRSLLAGAKKKDVNLKYWIRNID